jgi:hypothetical protein
VRVDYLSLPLQQADGVRSVPRPALSVTVVGARYPLPCLIDTGAQAVRLPEWAAADAGLSLAGAPSEQFWVGGEATTGRRLLVDLVVGPWVWNAPVWFCDPWPRTFGLLGQVGFLDRFRVTIDGYEQWIECEPGSSGSVTKRAPI